MYCCIIVKHTHDLQYTVSPAKNVRYLVLTYVLRSFNSKPLRQTKLLVSLCNLLHAYAYTTLNSTNSYDFKCVLALARYILGWDTSDASGVFDLDTGRIWTLSTDCFIYICMIPTQVRPYGHSSTTEYIEPVSLCLLPQE